MAYIPETNHIFFWFPFFFHEPPCTAGSNVIGKDEVHSGLSTTKDGDSRHEVNFSFSKDDNHICVICNDSYPQKSMLVEHIEEKHGARKGDTISDDEPDAEDISDDEQTSATAEEVATPSRRSSRLSKRRPRKWDTEDYADDSDRDDVSWSPSPTAEDGTATTRRSSRRAKRQRQQFDAEESTDTEISKRKLHARSYKLKPKGHSKKSGQAQKGVTKDASEGESDVEEESFVCRISPCTSKLSSRKTLISHVRGKHKYGNQESVKVVRTWYKYKSKSLPTKNDSKRSKQTQNTSECESEVRKDSFSCCISSCTYKVGTRRSLINHVMGQHKHNNQEAVEVVQTWYKRKSKSRPKNSHQNNRDPKRNPFVCEICKLVSYHRKQLLRDHMCEEHELTKEESEAEVAKVYGVLRSNRRPKLPDSVFCASGAKIEELHVGSDTNQASQSSDVVKTDTKPSCPKCGREFEHISQARMHFENDCTSNPLECDICGSNFESIEGYKCHMESHKNKEAGITYECQQCDKVFYHKYPFVQHEATHKNNFLCDICSKCFGDKGAFERHRNVNHTREEKYPCTLCPKVYYAKRQLKKHMRMVHEGQDEIVTCHICGKSVKKSSMGSHVKLVHIDETEKVMCPLCEREFKRQSYLDDHLREVHGSGQTETFPCPWPNCDKTFVRKRTMKGHYNTHIDYRPFSCTMCSNKFRKKSHLQNHLNWHNGVRPHQCQLCSKSFLTKGNLTKHLATHTK